MSVLCSLKCRNKSFLGNCKRFGTVRDWLRGISDGSRRGNDGCEVVVRCSEFTQG